MFPSLHSPCAVLALLLLQAPIAFSKRVGADLQHELESESSTEHNASWGGGQISEATATRLLKHALCAAQKAESLSAAPSFTTVITGVISVSDHCRDLPALDPITIHNVTAPCGLGMLQPQVPAIWEALSGDSTYVLKQTASSGSGAAFYWSPDNRFILKLLPSDDQGTSEVEQLRRMSTDLKARFQSKGNNRLEVALAPVYLHFESKRGSRSRHWILMQTESVKAELREAMNATEENSTYGVMVPKASQVLRSMVEFVDEMPVQGPFDVKPMPINSKDRKGLFEYINFLTSGKGMNPNAGWYNVERVLQTLLSDIFFLGSQSLVDYSVFVQFQYVNLKLSKPSSPSLLLESIDSQLDGIGEYLPRCTFHQSSELNPNQYVMACFSIIDYLMNFKKLPWYKKDLENAFMGHKWNDWQNKAQVLVECMFSPWSEKCKEYRVRAVQAVQAVEAAQAVQAVQAVPADTHA